MKNETEFDRAIRRAPVSQKWLHEHPILAELEALRRKSPRELVRDLLFLVLLLGLILLLLLSCSRPTLPYAVTDAQGYCLFIAEPWDTYPSGKPVGTACDAYYATELGAPMTQAEFNRKFGKKNS